MAIDHHVEVSKTISRITQLDAQLRAALGSAISGLSYDWTDQVIVHFLVADTSNDAVAQAIVAGHASLLLSVDNLSIAADNVEVASITCVDAVIAADASVDVCVWRTHAGVTAVWMAKTSVPLESNQLTLTFKTNLPGTYLFEVSRQGGSDYETGYIDLVAT